MQEGSSPYKPKGIRIVLSDTSEVIFPIPSLRSYPFLGKQKKVDQSLCDTLLSPDIDTLQLGEKNNKIFLGFGAVDPNDSSRIPVWLPADFISSHILVGGSIGSGKTSLTYRLISGALNTYGTVIVGEAKGGRDGKSEGAAFTNLASYLELRLSPLPVYRWPRGNHWFNPLLYLKRKKDRDSFLLTFCQQINAGGELQAYVQRAAKISSLIIEWMQAVYTNSQQQKCCTLRNLVKFLQEPDFLEKLIDKSIEECKSKANQLRSIKKQLQMMNFFILKDTTGREKAIMTLNALSLLCDLLNQDDLLDYSEARDGLSELKIDTLLYQRSLVIISQPLNDPGSKIIGPLFWDALLSRILELGPTPPLHDGKERQKVAVFLDETHRLPVGRLGESGDFLREYRVGLIEITPTIVDKIRWEQNKHVYQTIISLSPGVRDIIELLYDTLPNQEATSHLKIGISSNYSPNSSQFSVNDASAHYGLENTGTSVRAMRDTGKYSALLQSNLIAPGLLWLDLESPLLANFKVLIKDALASHLQSVECRAVDYALGLAQDFQIK